MKKRSSFLTLPGTVVSELFGRSWTNVMTFALGALSVPMGYLQAVPIFMERIDKIHFHRGKVGLGMYLKESQRCLLKCLAGEPIKASSVQLRKGLPVILPATVRKGILSDSIIAIRVALTLLGFARVIFHEGAIKFHTVTAPSEWREPSPHRLKKMIDEIWDILSDLGVGQYRAPSVPPENPIGAPLHRSNRMGPNGHSVFASHWDALVLRESGLWPTFKVLAEALGSVTLIRKVEILAQLTGSWLHARLGLTWSLPEHHPVLGRFGVKDEPCGKKRLFAISDYWTQSACKPLHDFLMGALKRLPMDGTWDQGRASERVREETAKGTKLYSFDLSAATDRFPARFTELVLGPLIGPDAASAWVTLLTERPYHYKGSEYRYNAGQPMGTLSSWASFALSHHVVVQMAARNAGHSGLFTQYALLGDDIVIFDEYVAMEYRDLMDWLKVDINLSKSVVGVSLAEFAKRVFYKGHEVSGVPAKLLRLCALHISGLRVLFETVKDRGWEVSVESILGALCVGTDIHRYPRLWRLALVSIVGPGAPFSRPALWGGAWMSPMEDLIRFLFSEPAGLIRLPPLQPLQRATNQVAPWIDWSGLGIERCFEIRRIRRARETWTAWRSVLETSLDSLALGWIVSGQQDRLVPESVQEIDLKMGRSLIEAGHPATWLIDQPLTEGVSDWDITNLARPVVASDRPVAAVVGIAPSGELKLLTRAVDDTRFAMDVLRSIATVVPLLQEWRDPGAFDAIADGLLLEVAGDCEAVRLPGWTPPPVKPKRPKGKRGGNSRR
jgi:hypothetical protein